MRSQLVVVMFEPKTLKKIGCICLRNTSSI